MIKLIKIKTILMTSVALLSLSGAANAALINLDNTYTLAPNFSSPRGNFHPQGLGYDTASGELLYMQQNVRRIDRSDIFGVFTGSTSIDFSHGTSVAADSTNYYYSNYTSNANGPDLYSKNKITGVRTQISSDVLAYGGYPIDVRDGKMYRSEYSTTYSWANLSSIRISNLSTIDSIDQTVTLDTLFGIADFGIDSVNNEAWVLDYNANAAIRRFDLTTGALLDVFAVGVDGLDAGLTYANGKLYVYDWVENGPSTLRSYSVSGVNVVSAPASLPMILAGIIGVFFIRKSSIAS
ncbi:hypothetical protein [Glaciecola sp. MF2-115]|uniref:hypothetical protein n=1 Tax=Glaciecola sp. MF2-115 TaxID=3384827 RepID=UPI0039A2C290